MRETFTLKEEHITLLQHAYISWNSAEFGAPEINPKRPYGNSSVIIDLQEILGDEYSKEELVDLHNETQTALQILIQHATVDEGTYSKEKYTSNWEKE